MSEMTDASISFDSQLNMCEKRLCVYGDEWEPGEYVAKVLHGVGAEPLELTHERVIRCRDCRFSIFEVGVGDYIGHGTCRRAPVGPAHIVQFSGSCFWAEPREES